MSNDHCLTWTKLRNGQWTEHIIVSKKKKWIRQRLIWFSLLTHVNVFVINGWHWKSHKKTIHPLGTMNIHHGNPTSLNMKMSHEHHENYHECTKWISWLFVQCYSLVSFLAYRLIWPSTWVSEGIETLEYIIWGPWICAIYEISWKFTCYISRQLIVDQSVSQGLVVALLWLNVQDHQIIRNHSQGTMNTYIKYLENLANCLWNIHETSKLFSPAPKLFMPYNLTY